VLFVVACHHSIIPNGEETSIIYTNRNIYNPFEVDFSGKPIMSS
jgi:hypothetical protein